MQMKALDHGQGHKWQINSTLIRLINESYGVWAGKLSSLTSHSTYCLSPKECRHNMNHSINQSARRRFGNVSVLFIITFVLMNY